MIGHGRPAPEHRVELTIVDESGALLPEGHLGEIVVAGPSVTGGYGASETGGEIASEITSATRFSGGRLHTGDAGFLSGADLFVLGRMGDSLRANGVTVHVKPRRRHMWQLLQAGELPSTAVVVAAPERGGGAC